MKIAIVTVGYNRGDSLMRLWRSLQEACYGTDRVDLIISLDRSDCQAQMISLAEAVEWRYGNKRIRAFEERQGLKKHILQCGSLTEEYDAVIVLEDDLIVSKGFYTYAKQCVQRYCNDNRIAGISLYSHQTVPGCVRPFVPQQNGTDVFLLQYAQSWGQCWTKRMWNGFRSWLENQNGNLTSEGIIPEYVAQWDERSWLKYHIKYTAQTNQYFVYPYVSLTTNAGDAGVHSSTVSTRFQVPLQQGCVNYRFPESGAEIKYDVFFERVVDSKELLPRLAGEKRLDLYGDRTDFSGADYLISTQKLHYQVAEEIGILYRPHEENVFRECPGHGIYVYDLHTDGNGGASNRAVLFGYDTREIPWKNALHYGFSGFLNAIRRKLGKK